MLRDREKDLLGHWGKRGGIMRVILTYEGPLLSKGNPEALSVLREAFHPQLIGFWESEPALRQRYTYLAKGERGPTMALAGPHVQVPPAEVFEKGGHDFIPLVTRNLNLVCHLEVRMFRWEAPGGLIGKGGDIDNRLKTLFDSLRVPNKAQIKSPPSSNPMFCLLEDDALVTSFQVTTEQIFAPMRKDQSANDIQMTITVVIRPTLVTHENLSFVSSALGY